jgi:hypothetical protein
MLVSNLYPKKEKKILFIKKNKILESNLNNKIPLEMIRINNMIYTHNSAKVVVTFVNTLRSFIL